MPVERYLLQSRSEKSAWVKVYEGEYAAAADCETLRAHEQYVQYRVRAASKLGWGPWSKVVIFDGWPRESAPVEATTSLAGAVVAVPGADGLVRRLALRCIIEGADIIVEATSTIGPTQRLRVGGLDLTGIDRSEPTGAFGRVFERLRIDEYGALHFVPAAPAARPETVQFVAASPLTFHATLPSGGRLFVRVCPMAVPGCEVKTLHPGLRTVVRRCVGADQFDGLRGLWVSEQSMRIATAMRLVETLHFEDGGDISLDGLPAARDIPEPIVAGDAVALFWDPLHGAEAGTSARSDQGQHGPLTNLSLHATGPWTSRPPASSCRLEGRVLARVQNVMAIAMNSRMLRGAVAASVAGLDIAPKALGAPNADATNANEAAPRSPKKRSPKGFSLALLRLDDPLPYATPQLAIVAEAMCKRVSTRNGLLLPPIPMSTMRWGNNEQPAVERIKATPAVAAKGPTAASAVPAADTGRTELN
jgi:hypothetical protein